jgi:hypothetical protein
MVDSEKLGVEIKNGNSNHFLPRVKHFGARRAAIFHGEVRRHRFVILTGTDAKRWSAKDLPLPRATEILRRAQDNVSTAGSEN